MQNENEIINALWIGNELSKLELLTINSFLAHGHLFRLWVYDKPETKLPAGVEVSNASEIIPASKIFSYQHANKYGHGKGSFAGFSDIFRYRLLYELGGWWVDMDVTCLKPLNFSQPYFFRKHHKMAAVGSVMKAPKNSELMRLCYEEAINSIDSANINWHKPVEILNKYIVNENLTPYIMASVSNFDKWRQTSRYIWTGKKIPENWFFIHWQNEEWRVRGVNRNSFYYKSALARLMAGYNLAELPETTEQKLSNKIAHSWVGRKFNISKAII